MDVSRWAGPTTSRKSSSGRSSSWRWHSTGSEPGWQRHEDGLLFAQRLNGTVMTLLPIVDAHVHFWDPRLLHYPWLKTLPALERAFEPSDYASAVGDAPIEALIAV